MVTGGSNQSQPQQQTSNATTPTPPPTTSKIAVGDKVTNHSNKTVEIH
jgi:hypothetical protein